MWLPREARGGSDDGGGSVVKTPGRLVQPDVLDWLVCHDMKQKKQKADALRCGWDPVLRPCVVGTATTEHGKSPANSLVCLACLSHPFNENGMQCTPHTPFPSLYWNTLCPTVCAPPPPFNFKAANNNNKGGEDEWGWMNECAPSIPTPSLPANPPPTPLLPSSLPSISDILPSCMPFSTPALRLSPVLQPCVMTVASVYYTHIC